MKTIGIIGGMGPLAAADLFKKIIFKTDAKTDQDHIRILIDNNTNIPDRTACIKGMGPSPVDELIKSAKLLENAGADFIIVSCNTAHYFMPEVTPHIGIPFMSMIDETAKACKRMGTDCVGLLASEGTSASGIYCDALAHQYIDMVEPEPDDLHVVHEIIYDGIKAGNTSFDTTEFRRVLKNMQERGAKQFILGCTELPIAVEMFGIEGNFIDPTEILAIKAIEFAGAKVIG